jgi:hypothetical protein
MGSPIRDIWRFFHGKCSVFQTSPAYQAYLFFGSWCAIWALSCVGCETNPHNTPGQQPSRPASSASQSAAKTRILESKQAPRVATTVRDEKGQPISIACGVCHATRPADAQRRLGERLSQFHQHVLGTHGDLTCAACHNPQDGYDSLRRADGRTLAFNDIVQLCAQCHGTQHRDYLHGAHGGMMGFWDPSRGERVRHTCIVCHHPHSPKYPIVMPAHGPRDRLPLGDLND